MKISIIAVASLCTSLLAGCDGGARTTIGEVQAPSSAAPPTMAAFRWRLPRTVLDIDVALTPIGCDGRKFKVQVKPQLTPRAIPDQSIGGDGWVELDPIQLQSFWNDNSFTYKTYAASNGILQSVGSTSSSQVGTIIGNTITFAVKIAATAFGSPAIAAAVPAGVKLPNACGMSPALASALAKIASDKKSALGANAESAQKFAALVAALEDSITIHVKQTVDPGLTTPDALLSTADTLVYVEAPNTDDIKKRWLVHPKDKEVESLVTEVTTEVHLDFASSQRPCPIAGTQCVAETKPLPAGTLYREARYIPVTLVGHVPAGVDSTPQEIPFGQFGIARTLPVEAKAFKNLTWEVDLSSFGEVSGANFGSKSSGAAISGMLANAAGGASAIATEQRNAGVALPAETTLLQNQAAALKAQVDISTYQNQIKAAKLQAGQPDGQ